MSISIDASKTWKFYWLIAVVFVWCSIILSTYFPNDGDGTLYAQMARKIAERDFSELIAIGWYDFNKIYSPDAPESRYFYEHPPGFFVLPWLLGKFGFPSSKITLLAETIYQLLFLAFTHQFIQFHFDRRKADSAVLLLLLMPVSFWYVLRPVQEMPMLASLMAALLAVSWSQRKPRLAVVSLILVGGIAGLIKGIMVIPLVAVLFIAGFFFGGMRGRLTGAFLCSSAFAVGAYGLLTIFEKYRLSSVGDTFWLPYLKIQFWGRGLETSTPLTVATRTLNHAFVYIAALVYYACPWNIFALWATWKDRKKIILAPHESKTKIQAFLLLASFALSLPLSVFARWSVRYIFPAYYLLAVAGILCFLETRPKNLEKNGRFFDIVQSNALPLAAALWGISRAAAVVIITK